MSRGEEESVLRVVIKVKMKGKRPRWRPRLRWLDNIDSHLKGKNTSLKEVLKTKCFEDIDFSINWQEFWRRSLSSYLEYCEQTRCRIKKKYGYSKYAVAKLVWLVNLVKLFLSRLKIIFINVYYWQHLKMTKWHQKCTKHLHLNNLFDNLVHTISNRDVRRFWADIQFFLKMTILIYTTIIEAHHLWY